MGADLTKPFGESCCDGGECTIDDTSCQPCGCDKGMRRNGVVVGYLCAYHKALKAAIEEAVEKHDQEVERLAYADKLP